MSAGAIDGNGVNRLSNRLAGMAAKQHKALITFVTAGYPAPAQTAAIMHDLVRGGADVVELGVPFSDPMADGPTVQRASDQALKAGTTPAVVFDILAQFRAEDRDTPVVLMSYLNPIEVYGYEAFADAALEAGADGVLVVDLPPEEAVALNRALAKRGLCEIFLTSPTTSTERLARIQQLADGFLYYVSVKGVTGAGAINIEEVASKIALMRQHVKIPIAVGFAVKDAEIAARVAKVSDGVVVGSAVIEQIQRHDPTDSLDSLASFVRQLKTAIDSAKPL